jgi:hypothetical protein
LGPLYATWRAVVTLVWCAVAGPTAPATQVALNRTVQTMAANLRPISVLNMETS